MFEIDERTFETGERRVRDLDEQALRGCEGFSVRLGARRPAGVVEEVWLGADRRPAALVVSLPRRRRLVVSVDEIEEVDAERRDVRLDGHAELVDLDGRVNAAAPGTPRRAAIAAADPQAVGESLLAARDRLRRGGIERPFHQLADEIPWDELPSYRDGDPAAAASPPRSRRRLRIGRTRARARDRSRAHRRPAR